jgi:hypothetical protein
MAAALGTLPFLATLWLLVILGASILEESGARIAAALKGDAPQQQSSLIARRPHVRPHLRPISPVEPRWRAAA